MITALPDPWAMVTYAKTLPPDEPLLVRAGLIVELAARAETAPSVVADLTCAEVGRLFGRAESTVRAWCWRGEFPGSYRLHGRAYRIPQSAIAAFRAGQQAPAAGNPDLGAWRRVAAGTK